MSGLAAHFERRLGNGVGLVTTLAVHGIALLFLLTSRPQPETQPVPLMARLISDTPSAYAAPQPLRTQPVMDRPQLQVSQPEIALSDDAPAAAAPIAAASAAPSSAAATESRQAPDSLPRFDADYLKNPAPVYPRVSRRLREEGVVMLRVYVSPDGAPEVVELKGSSGSPRLDQSALEAVRQWKFLPARSGGQAIGAWVNVPIEFSLNV